MTTVRLLTDWQNRLMDQVMRPGSDLNKLHESTQYILVTHAVYGAEPRSIYC